MSWWRRSTRRGAHRRGQTYERESVHAATAAASHEQARISEAENRASEAEMFMRQFRRAFNLPNGHGTGTA